MFINRFPSMLFSLLIVLAGEPSVAETITVRQDGSGSQTTIQAAIDAASESDEIIVWPGTYIESISFGGKNLTLRSTDPTSSSIVQTTIIDGDQNGSVVAYFGYETSASMLSGFTIRNGNAAFGGGIDGMGCTAVIQYNIIIGNSADQFGGGLDSCDGTILHNTITSNTGQLGGGLANCNGVVQDNVITYNSTSDGGGLNRCSGTIERNVISGNQADNNGGGLFLCDGVVRNNLIYGNSGGSGGGMLQCGGFILNNTIYGNTAVNSGGGIRRCFGSISNNIIWANTAQGESSQVVTSNPPSFSCIQDYSGSGTGNISDDPLLVDSGNDDFHLLPGSPCRDTGATIDSVMVDFDGLPRPQGSAHDIGAYEFFVNPTGIPFDTWLRY